MQVCVIPLGTGNDFSRVTGWGSGFSSVSVGKFSLDTITRINQGQITPFDRFRVSFENQQPKLLINYFSVGKRECVCNYDGGGGYDD